MPNANDNRMGWIRNLEALDSGGQQYTIEFELGSECQISGLLDCADGKIICAATSTEESGFHSRVSPLRAPSKKWVSMPKWSSYGEAHGRTTAFPRRY